MRRRAGRREAPAVNSHAREGVGEGDNEMRSEGPAQMPGAAPSALYSGPCPSRPDGRAYSLPALRASSRLAYQLLGILSRPAL